MPLRTLLRYKNPDISADVNTRLRDLVTKGVFLGGQVNPVAGTLDVSVPALGAVGADGMITVLEGAAETLTCTAGISQWVLLHSYYVANDLPVAALEVLSELAYDALSADEQNRRVKLARVTLGAAVTEVTSDDISYVDSERIDPLTRSPFRGTVATRTDLPDWSDPPSGITRSNQPYDLYFVEDERIFYTWGLAGTPAWQRVISALEEFELASHKNNEDDGTVAPDFFEAQHVDVIHRQALDAGSASQVQHGANGTAFGATNPFVDSALPWAVLSRQDFTGLLSVTKVQLSGTYYVGTGLAGTATSQFRTATYQDARVLLGGNRRPITVLRVKTSDDAGELDPSLHADDLGYYDDPIVELDFTKTLQANYSGNLSIYGRIKWLVGELQPGNESLENVGLGFVRAAEDIPVTNNAFTQISGSLDVQEALEDLDAALAGAVGGADETLKKIVNLGSLVGGPDPDQLNWYGGTSSALGRLDDVSDNPRINALANDLYLEALNGRTFSMRWSGTPKITFDNLPRINAVGSNHLTLNVPTGSRHYWQVNNGAILWLGLESGNPQFGTQSEDLYFNVPTGKTYVWQVNSGTELTLAAGTLTVGGTVLSTGLNAGGSATPSSGNAILTGGLVVGFDADPTADQVQIGDAAYALKFDGTDPFIQFDTSGGTDQLWYDRSGDALFFDVAGSTELIADANGLRVGDGLYVGSTGVAPSAGDIIATNYVYANGKRFYFGSGNNDWIEYEDTGKTLTFTIDNAAEYTFTPSTLDVTGADLANVGTVNCTDLAATTYVQAATFQLDSTDKMVFTDNTSVAWTVNNVEELRLRTDGLGINKGLHIGALGGTIYDNDIVVSGGINVGGTVDPAVGDGIFTNGLVVGSDSAATSGNIDVGGDIFAGGGINAGGGTTNPTTGDGIFSGGLVVGADAAPNGGDIRLTGGVQAGGTANPDAGVGIFTSAIVGGRDGGPPAISSIKGYLYGAAVGTAASGTILLTEATGASYIGMLSDTSAGLLIGDGAAADSGSLLYTHSSDQWAIGAGGSTTAVIRSNQMAVGNSPAITTTAALSVDSTTRGFLPPRMTTTERTNIGSPAEGLIVFDTTLSALYVYQGAAWHSINVT